MEIPPTDSLSPEAGDMGCWFKEKLCCVLSRSVVSHSLRLHRLYSSPGSSVLEILQARMLEWGTISFLQRIFPPQVSCFEGGAIFTV